MTRMRRCIAAGLLAALTVTGAGCKLHDPHILRDKLTPIATTR